MNLTPKKLALAIVPWFSGLTVLMTGGLLWIKGVLPMTPRLALWILGAAAMPAVLSSLILWVMLWVITARTDFFHRPFDIGRAISLGGISGSIVHALSAVALFHLLHHGKPAPFWIATAMISGCLSGAGSFSIILSRFSKLLPAHRKRSAS